MTNNKKIMIIDDEVDLAQMVSFQFSSKGFDVQSAGDGVEALEKVHQFKPDLIILDMNMPRMGGIEFYSKICGPNGRPLYPVLVLTARANVRDMFKDLDIDGFMIKPFEIDHLIHEAELIIKKKSHPIARTGQVLTSSVRRVCIVEEDQNMFSQLSNLFLNADYTVIPARKGSAALERMMKDVPDVALVHLGLSDIPGDLVILRLSQMAKTMEVKFLLYSFRDRERDPQVMKRISEKKGIYTFVEYNEIGELLVAANKILK